jgi:shikimate dehydrogenase
MTQKAAVIGHPVGHSKSPLIHGYWIQKYGLDADYIAIDIDPDNFENEIQKLVESGICGFNVTVPFKEKILPLCEDTDDLAARVGAVNTINVKAGKLYGTNTDVFGFIENIKTQAPKNVFEGPAGIIGAGGAARATIIGLLDQDVPEIRITNRTFEKALKLKELSPEKIVAIPWNEREETLPGLSLLANTTSLGMQGQPPLDFPLDTLQDYVVVCDIVYAPLETELLHMAKMQGNPIVTGIGMLLHQARPAFKGWFNVMPDVDAELERLVLA